MLPVVDPNWHIEDIAQPTPKDFHVLRAVTVQSRRPHALALADLQQLSTRANTPGSGGLPNAVIVYCDIAAVDAISLLTELSSFEKVKGVSYEIKQADIASLHPSLQFLSEHKLSLDIHSNINSAENHLEQITKIAEQFPALIIVLNLNQLNSEGIGHKSARWLGAVKACAKYPNLFLKVVGYTPKGDKDNSAMDLDMLQRLIRGVGSDRLMLAGEGQKGVALGLKQSVWSRYAEATHWTSASERDKLFRKNAMQVYGLT